MISCVMIGQADHCGLKHHIELTILFYYIIILIVQLSTLTHMISPATHSEHTVKHQSCRATSPLTLPAHTNLTCWCPLTGGKTIRTSWAGLVFAAAKITVWQSCADSPRCTDGFGCSITSCCPLDWGGCHHWTMRRLIQSSGRRTPTSGWKPHKGNPLIQPNWTIYFIVALGISKKYVRWAGQPICPGQHCI